jgi:hypothetical protein
MASVIRLEYPEMKTKECPNSKERRSYELPDVWRYAQVIIKPLNDEYVQEEIERHKYNEPCNFSRRLTLAIVRVIYPVPVYHEKDNVTRNRRHDETYWVRNAGQSVKKKIRCIRYPKQYVPSYLDLEEFNKCFKSVTFFLFCHLYIMIVVFIDFGQGNGLKSYLNVASF